MLPSARTHSPTGILPALIGPKNHLSAGFCKRLIYHAEQHLCDVAKAIYGPGTDLADRSAKDRRDELVAGRLGAVVAALRIHVETTPEARKCIHYVFRNRHRMRYPQFRARGLCVSSGVVEAGCKQIGRPAQTRRHALDRRRGQRHHRPALLHPQRTLRGLLGATSQGRRLTLISQ